VLGGPGRVRRPHPTRTGKVKRSATSPVYWPQLATPTQPSEPPAPSPTPTSKPGRNVRAVTTDNGSGETLLEAVGLPSIPVSAGALIYDRTGRLLILKPTYKSGWTIPGGVMEADGETPWDACRRELAEECGLHIGAGHPARLACMDFRRPRPGKPGGIRYLFDCGAFGQASLAGIVVQPEEIAEYRVADLRTALMMLRKPIRLRVRAATRGHALCYLEDGRLVPGVGTASTSPGPVGMGGHALDVQEAVSDVECEQM
jgi:8-oxo-dGTP diphosphatase